MTIAGNLIRTEGLRALLEHNSSDHWHAVPLAIMMARRSRPQRLNQWQAQGHPMIIERAEQLSIKAVWQLSSQGHDRWTGRSQDAGSLAAVR